jgi:AraC family transcriptional regulator
MKLNPASSEIGRSNAILRGRSRDYHVRDFAGVLSIKSVTGGCARWTAGRRTFDLTPGTWLNLNDDQVYSIDIESATPVSTFCLFFARGAVADVQRNLEKPARQLLDSPEYRSSPIELPVLVRPRGSKMSALLNTMSNAPQSKKIDWEECFWRAAVLLLEDATNSGRSADSLSAQRMSTRVEIHRRLQIARDYMLSNLASGLETEQVAREACMSTFHFHRSFIECFGTTPQGFVREERLKLAHHLCIQADLSIAEICAQCGYRSLGSFTTAFQHRFGMGPRGLRRKYRIEEA